MTVTCATCGKSSNTDNLVCDGCGSSLTHLAPNQTAKARAFGYEEGLKAAAERAKAQRKATMHWLQLAGIAIVLFAIWFAFSRNGKHEALPEYHPQPAVAAGPTPLTSRIDSASSSPFPIKYGEHRMKIPGPPEWSPAVFVAGECSQLSSSEAAQRNLPTGSYMGEHMHPEFEHSVDEPDKYHFRMYSTTGTPFMTAVNGNTARAYRMGDLPRADYDQFQSEKAGGDEVVFFWLRSDMVKKAN